jgi:hypothetical protein
VLQAPLGGNAVDKLHCAFNIKLAGWVVDERGLFLLVNPKGSKLWRFKYRYGNKEKQLSFGAYPDVTLAQARGAL